MENEMQVLEIPYGMRDFLPIEAAEKRAIEEKLASLYVDWGYDEVVTPTIEYLDNLVRGSRHSIETHLFKLFDRKNNTLALRHEMTTPIARLAASRLQGSPLPLKLSYSSNVFRYEEMQAGRQCEFHQSGVELMGSTAAGADAEIIALAVKGIVDSGISAFTVCLGQVDFATGIMEQFQLSDQEQHALQASLEQHDFVQFETQIDRLSVAEGAKKTLRQIPLLSGGEDVLEKAYALALSEKSKRALDNLRAIHRLLKAYGANQYVRFDLGILRDFSYYTGMVFEIYTDGLGFPLAGGGRYDHLLSDFGNPCPATGFAIGIERILLALTRQNLARPETPKDVYIGFSNGAEEKAIEEAGRLRQEGKVVELSPSGLSRAEAEVLQKKKGYAKLVYLA